MCGIVGMACKWSNGFTNTEMEVFETMLFLDTLRGWDSTGVFGVDTNGNVQIHKEATHGPDFICSKEFQEFSKEAVRRGRFVVGHNRAATRGAVNDKNAHPFYVEDKVILVQNGTYWGDHKKLADVEVDSEAIAHVLVETPDVAEALRKVNAAYALAWYDTRSETMNLIRNSHRPMFVAETNQGTIIWASEGNTILYAAARHNLELKEKPKQLPEHELFQMKMEKGGSFDKSQSKLDCSFRSPYSGPSKPHHAACAWSGLEEGEAHNDREWPFGGSRMGVHNRHSFSDFGSRGPVKSNLLESNGFLTEYKKYSKPVRFLEEDVTRLVNHYKREAEIVMEVEDYLFCNDERDCEAFFILGSPLVADNPTELLPPCYFIMKGITEDRALQYAGKFVKVKILNFTSMDAGYNPNPDLKVVGIRCQFLEEILDSNSAEEVHSVQ